MFLNNIYIIKYYFRKQSLGQEQKKDGTWLILIHVILIDDIKYFEDDFPHRDFHRRTF